MTIDSNASRKAWTKECTKSTIIDLVVTLPTTRFPAVNIDEISLRAEKHKEDLDVYLMYELAEALGYTLKLRGGRKERETLEEMASEMHDSKCTFDGARDPKYIREFISSNGGIWDKTYNELTTKQQNTWKFARKLYNAWRNH